MDVIIINLILSGKMSKNNSKRVSNNFSPTGYSEKVMDHFMHPRNLGSLKDPDVIGMVGNPVCGDTMVLSLKVGKNSQKQDYIKQIAFETLGCGAAIATSSIITEMAMGKTLEEAWQISDTDVAGELGGLPPVKMHCSNLAASALKQAIEKYYAKNSQKNDNITKNYI